jgi:voltage-gated potassium channel
LRQIFALEVQIDDQRNESRTRSRALYYLPIRSGRRHVIEQLNRDQIPYVLIETNEGLYRQLLHEGALVLNGDAKRHSVLEEAGIARARGLCVVIDNDADNLYITVTAKALNPKARIITRAGQSRYAQAMRNSGADEVIIPEYEGGLMTGRMIAKFYPGAHPNLE